MERKIFTQYCIIITVMVFFYFFVLLNFLHRLHIRIFFTSIIVIAMIMEFKLDFYFNVLCVRKVNIARKLNRNIQSVFLCKQAKATML